MKLASEMGVLVASPWVTWVKASIVPALCGLLITPLLMYKLFAPEIKDTPEAPKVKRGAALVDGLLRCLLACGFETSHGSRCLSS